MNVICPSILSADFARLGDQIAEVKEAGAKYLHIDIMDGVFVPSISFGMPVVKGLRRVTDLVFDVHLMILDPIRYVKEFAECGADIITFHYEAAENPRAVIDEIHSCGKKAGIAIKPGTPVSEIIQYLDVVEMVLVMTVEPGFGGQKLIPDTLDKIREVRKIIVDRNLNADVEVDGGVYTSNVETVLEAGANVIVSGSGVFNGGASKNMAEYRRILGV